MPLKIWRITMKIKSLCITLFLFGSIFLLQAAEDVNLLIAVDSSEFKTELSQQILDLADAESYNVTVWESVKTIQGRDLGEFDAVIAINRATVGRMNRKLIKVLEEGRYPSMVIVTSYGDPETSKDDYSAYNAVDGITTASLKNSSEIKDLAQEIFSRVQELLK